MSDMAPDVLELAEHGGDDIVERLRKQVTFPPVNGLRLRLLLDWAADEIEALRRAAR